MPDELVAFARDEREPVVARDRRPQVVHELGDHATVLAAERGQVDGADGRAVVRLLEANVHEQHPTSQAGR
jgi:hypothetical protein